MTWRYFLLSIVLSIVTATLVEASVAGTRSTCPQQRTARCKAIRRSPSPAKEVNIKLRYLEFNNKAPQSIIMVHGWPGSSGSWERQSRELQKDYHLIIPDLRGFGESTHPGDVRSSYTMGDLVGDLVCILGKQNVKTTICLGHDWGAQVCHEAARMRPDIFTSVIGVAFPYSPYSGPFVPIELVAKQIPTFNYQVYFDNHTEAAVAELNRDVQRTVRATMRTIDSPPPKGFLTSQTDFLKVYDGADIAPVPFFSKDEEARLVKHYLTQGYGSTLGFFTTENRRQTWELAQSQGNFTIPCPTLAILPTQDPVVDWAVMMKILRTKEHVPNLNVQFVEGSHWLHLEKPEAVNAIIKGWLKELVPVTATMDEEKRGFRVQA